jgi:hypothetical protein
LLLTFRLDAPEEHTTIVGDINIQWAGTDGPLQPRNDADNLICSGLGVSSQPVTASGESEIKMKMLKLDSLSKKDLYKRLNEQFRSKPPVRSCSIVPRKSEIDIKPLSRGKLKDINYSKMTYQAQDTIAYRRKNERVVFIKEYLKSKGIN